MATARESTTTPALARSITYDRTARDFLMRLGGEPIGYARTYHQAEITLEALATEVLHHRHAALLDTLDTLDRMSGTDAPAFRQARVRLLLGVEIGVAADGAAYQIDGLLVQPDPAQHGWPWRCPCEQARCWHAALAEALVMVLAESDGAAVVAVFVREG
ncbi:MAG: hypothetical protein OHK0022_12940 [Roseiflexaceae bacterium]